MTRDTLPPNEPSLVLRTLDMLRRRAILAILVSAAVIASAVSFALYLPDLFRATAVLLVERPVPETFVRPAVSGELESRLHVIKQEILSRDRLTELITRFDLYPDLRNRAPMDAVLDQMRRDIEVELTGPEQVSGRKTTVSFRLSYTGRTGATVADVTNALAAFYVAQNERMRSQEATRTTEFLKSQLDGTRKQLDQHEHEMRVYTTAHPGELPQQVEVNLAALERLNTQLRLNGERQLKIMEDREKFSDGLTVTVDARTGEQRIATPIPGSDRLETMRKNLQLLEGQFMSKHPDVVRLKTEIAAVEREQADALVRQREANPQTAGADKIAAAPPPAPAAPAARLKAVEGLNAELDKLKIDEAGLRQNIATFERRLEGVPEREQEFGRLTRDHGAAKDLYDSLLKRFDEAQLAESMEVDRQGERFRILESALPPSSPIAPNRVRLMILGVMFGLVAALGAVVTAEQFDPSFHSLADLREFTSVPVLATIPRISSGRLSRVLRMTLATASVVAVIVLIATISAHIARGNEQIVWMLARGA
jgi:succinoglycan biosynthesis transport protein ExoP